MVSRYGLYAYGMTGKQQGQPDIVGIDKKHKVYPVEWKDLWVLVSKIDIEQFQQQVKDVIAALTKTPDPSQHRTMDILEAHEYVIDSLMQSGTVVPLKFGTILRDEHAALQMLQEQEENFRGLLSRLKGKVEWGLKVYADRKALMKRIEHTQRPSTNVEARGEKLSRGAAYLLGRKKEEELKGDVINQFARIAQEIFHALGKDACEAKVMSTLSQKASRKEKEMILNAVYLIEKEKVAHFRQQRETFMEKYASIGIDLDFSGPWPPYNFT